MCVCVVYSCVQKECAVEESQQQIHSQVDVDAAVGEKAIPEEHDRAGTIAIVVVVGQREHQQRAGLLESELSHCTRECFSPQ